MAVIHIPEEEAHKDMSPFLDKLTVGDTLLIDREHGALELTVTVGRFRTAGEAMETLRNLPGERGVMDSAFAADVKFASDRLRTPPTSSPWD